MLEPLILWDLDDDPDGNVVHIREHGITQDDVEEILQNSSNRAVASRSSERAITFGWTSSGLYIAVVWEAVADDPRTVMPVTAYRVAPPTGRHHA